MRVEDAIKYLKESKCEQNQGESYQEYHNNVLNLVIKSLEKQISLAPLNKRIRNEELIGSCPTCKMKWNVGYWEKYCSNCGQKLDWS